MDSGKYLVFRNVDTAVFVITDIVRRATDRRDACILRVIRKSSGRGGRRLSRCKLDVGERCEAYLDQSPYHRLHRMPRYLAMHLLVVENPAVSSQAMSHRFHSVPVGRTALPWALNRSRPVYDFRHPAYLQEHSEPCYS